MVYDAVYLGFGFLGFTDFGGDYAVLDDDFPVCEEFREDIGVGVGAECDFACVAVAEEDFGFAGVFVCPGGESEGNRCHSLVFLTMANLRNTGDKIK